MTKRVSDPARGLVRLHRRGKWFTVQINMGGYWVQVGGAETRRLYPDAASVRHLIRYAVNRARREGERGR